MKRKPYNYVDGLWPHFVDAASGSECDTRKIRRILRKLVREAVSKGVRQYLIKTATSLVDLEKHIAKELVP